MLVVVVFLSVIQVWVPTWVFTFYLWSSRGLPIFSQTTYIKSFSSVMSFIGIFHFLGFRLDCPPVSVPEKRQCGFHFRHDSFNDIFISFFLLGKCLCLCAYGAWVIVMLCLFRSLWLSCIYCLAYCGRSLLMSLSIHLWWISSISRSENQPFFCYCLNLVSEPLVCCLKSAKFCPDFYHSFSISSFGRVTYIMLVCYLPKSIFYTVVSGVCGWFVHHLCTWKKNYLCSWKKNSQHLKEAVQSPMLSIKGTPADHDTQTCRLGTMMI